ncbi:MAG: ankyrin repeat domain-containing protein [Akkermansia sp.]|nr:ankyrin repeat domain-containing protein [Akkermansia sp.]
MKNTLLLSLLLALSASAVSEHRADGASPLHHAWREESSRLIAAGADVNARDAAGRTPLFYVNYPPKAALLLRSGADVHARDAAGNTPLLGLFGIATGGEELSPERMAEIVRMLADAGADMKARNNAGYNALDLALAVKWNGNLPDDLRPYGLSSTPERELVHACGAGDLQKVQYLLGQGVDPNSRDIHGNYALSKVLDEGVLGRVPHATEMMEALLAAGANPDIENGAPLYRSCLLGAVDHVKLLLQYGADAKLRPLRCVITPFPPQLLQLLQEAGATINH